MYANIIHEHQVHVCVQYKGVRSSEFEQFSGVPQGSILGPLLFVIFINDIIENDRIQFLMYADDIKMFAQINNLEDCLMLQNSLENMNKWCSNNNLLLNLSKCYVMTYTRKHDPLTYGYQLSDTLLSRPEYMVDLGVCFDAKLSFVKHMELAVSSATKNLGFVIRNSKEFKNQDTFRLLYVSFVRSKLEYASAVWNPIYQIHKDSIEKVQRRFMKATVYKLDGVYPYMGFPHNELLSRLNLAPLDKRRAIQQVIILHKLFNNVIDCPDLLTLISIRVPRLGLRCYHTFNLPAANTNLMFASPIYQMIKYYSALEDDLDIFCSTPKQVKQFISQL